MCTVIISCHFSGSVQAFVLFPYRAAPARGFSSPASTHIRYTVVKCVHQIPCPAEACATSVRPTVSSGSLATVSDLIDPTPLLSPFAHTQESWVINAPKYLLSAAFGIPIPAAAQDIVLL
jgi:hypothetical protein